jgi:PAS domain S-box-containing protein
MSKRRSGVDTIKRTDTERAQRRMDELFRALIENTSDIITILDAEGIIRYESPSVERVLGYKPQELIGRDIAELLHPDDLSKSLQAYAAMKAGVRSGTSEICQITEERLRHKDGSWRILEGFAKVLDTPSGAGIVIDSRDITERKRVEQELHESEERYRSLVEAAPDVIYTVSAEDGSITSLNPAFETLTGWSHAEWLGKSFVGIVHPDDLPVAVETFQKALRGETQPPSECRVLSKSGEYLVGEFTFTPHVKDGRVVGELGIARDITARKRAEEALKKSTQLLRDVGEMAKVGGWELDLSTKEVSWTEEVCRIHGVGPGYKPTLEEAMNFYAPESRPGLAEAMKKAEETGEPWDLESLFIPSGSKDKIWVRSLGRAVYSGGRIAKLAGTFQNIDKYKRVEEALRESEEKHRTLFETMAQGVVYQNAEGHIISANPAAQRLLGLTLAQLQGRTPMDPGWKVIHEDGSDFPSDMHPPMIALKTGKEVSHVVIGVFHPGANEYVWINIHAVPQFRPGETKPHQVYSTFDDLTERKRAEEALRESEARFRAIFENAAIGIALVDVNGHPVESNPALQKMLGYNKFEMADMAFTQYTHPDDARAGWDLFIELGEGKRDHYQIEKRFLRKDGQVVWGQLTVSLVRDQKGEFKYCIGMVEDISERKRAVEALRESEEHFRSFVENATVGIYRTTPDGHILMANPALVRMLGFDSSEELAGRNLECGGFEPSYPRSVFRERIEREGQVIGLEGAWIRRDGSVVFVRESAKTVRADDGRALHYDGVVEDITTRRHAEEGLRQLSGRLLRLQDEERRRIGRQLHETIAQSLAGLAVNLIMVKTSAADLSPRASACLSESLELAEQSSREIRTLSYLLHPPLVDEAGLAPALRWYTAGFAQRSGIEVHVDVSPEFGRLPSEHELTLYRIVQEALTNIHHHSGSKIARICLERQPHEIVLTVEDEGHGFSSAALGMAGPESANLGVGIPGMRERVRQLGGRLNIQTGSQGTTLTAYLPLSQVAHAEATHLTGG